MSPKIALLQPAKALKLLLRERREPCGFLEKSLHLVFGCKNLNGATKLILFLLENTPYIIPCILISNQQGFVKATAVLLSDSLRGCCTDPQFTSLLSLFEETIYSSELRAPAPLAVLPGVTQLPPCVSLTTGFALTFRLCQALFQLFKRKLWEPDRYGHLTICHASCTGQVNAGHTRKARGKGQRPEKPASPSACPAAANRSRERQGIDLDRRRHCAKHFARVISFNPHDNPIREGL